MTGSTSGSGHVDELPFRRVIVAAHYLFHGASDELEEYLRGRTEKLMCIAHPLNTAGGASQVRLYRHGSLVSEGTHASPRQPLRYFRELQWIVKWATPQAPFDLFVATDNLLSLSGLWLRRCGRVKRVAMYAFDFVPRRFHNRLLNFIYHRVDRFAVRHVDVVWNVSPAIEIARHERDGRVPTAPQIVVPIGARTDRIELVPLDEANQHQLVFVSHLLEKQGLQLVIEAMALIRREVPGTTLLVIGDGPYRDRLEKMVLDHDAADAVEFVGQLDDHSQIERMVTHGALALAPYVPDPLSWTRFADPSKIKLYLACGLPIVTTDMFWNARQIAACGAGKIITYDVPSLVDAVVGYLKNRESLEAARKAAADFALDFAWDRIFSTALRTTGELTTDGLKRTSPSSASI